MSTVPAVSTSHSPRNPRPRFSALALPLVPLLLAGVSACDFTGAPNREPVSISFSGAASAATSQLSAPAAGMAASVVLTSGANTLVIDRAQVVVRRVKLKAGTGTSCSDDRSSSDSTSSDSTSDDSSRSDSSSSSSDSSSATGACQELYLGPVLVELPLNENEVTSISALVPRGTYREIEFKIHKLGDDTPEERELARANPAFDRNSIRVEGTFNGTPFVFLSDVNEERELEFRPAVVIDAANENVTIQFDVARWFRAGSAVIDPATANKGGPNEDRVRDNIRASIRAFEDGDRNGR